MNADALVSFLLLAFRIGGFVFGFPWFAGAVVPRSVRLAVGVALLCGVSLYVPGGIAEPQLVQALSLPIAVSSLFTPLLLMQLLAEFAVGALYALLSGAAFLAIQAVSQWCSKLLSTEGDEFREPLAMPWEQGVRFALGLAVGGAVFHHQAVEIWVLPLVRSLAQDPLGLAVSVSAPASLAALLSAGSAIFVCSLAWALPYFAVAVSLDFFQTLALRYISPLAPAGVIAGVRAGVLLLCISVGIFYLELEARRFSRTWVEKQSGVLSTSHLESATEAAGMRRVGYNG